MGFDLKKLLKSVAAYNQKPQEVIVKEKEATEAEIILPVYEIEEEITVPVKKRKPNSDIDRKVPLNPLSD